MKQTKPPTQTDSIALFLDEESHSKVVKLWRQMDKLANSIRKEMKFEKFGSSGKKYYKTYIVKIDHTVKFKK